MRNPPLTAIELFRKEFESALGADCKTILDIGCGTNSPIKFLRKKIYSIGIDAHIPSLKKSMQEGIHNLYFNMTFSQLDEIESCSFDCVIAMDVIEHVKKEYGLHILDNMQRIAKKRMIVFTPNGFVPQCEYDNNPWQTHRSGWTVKEMTLRGYKVIGINGLRTLRGERSIIRFKPKRLWEIVSMLTQYIVRNHPEFAFQMLCVKSKNR